MPSREAQSREPTCPGTGALLLLGPDLPSSDPIATPDIRSARPEGMVARTKSPSASATPGNPRGAGSAAPSPLTVAAGVRAHAQASQAAAPAQPTKAAATESVT